MSLHRRAAKRDANEAQVFAAFRAAGCSILPISATGAPDAIVFHQGRNGFWLVEIKSKKGRLTEPQKRFRETWNGPEIYTIRTPEQAIELLKG